MSKSYHYMKDRVFRLSVEDHHFWYRVFGGSMFLLNLRRHPQQIEICEQLADVPTFWSWPWRCFAPPQRNHSILLGTPLKFNSSPLKIGRAPKGNSSSNHHFSGAMLNFGGVTPISIHFPFLFVKEDPEQIISEHLDTVDGRYPAPVEVGSLSLYLQGFCYIPGGFLARFLATINSITIYIE